MKQYLLLIVFSFPVLCYAIETRTLKDSLSKALEHSPYLKLQQKNVDAQKAEVRIAWSPFLPQMQSELGKGLQSKTNYFTKLQKKRFDATGNSPIMSINTELEQNTAYWNVTAKQELFKGFGNYHNLKEKKKLLEMAELDHTTEKNNLIYTVIGTYVEILNLENTLDFLEKAKAAGDHSL